jgi:hypothetical protein
VELPPETQSARSYKFGQLRQRSLETQPCESRLLRWRLLILGSSPPATEDAMKPTETAHLLFNLAHSNNVPRSKNMPDGLQDTLNYMIQGLAAMTTGMRATYIKLEEIERLIKR